MKGCQVATTGCGFSSPMETGSLDPVARPVQVGNLNANNRCLKDTGNRKISS